MAAVLTVVRFGHKSGLKEDEVVNTWTCLTPSVAFVLAEAQVFGADLWDFYTAVPAGGTGSKVQDYLSPSINFNGVGSVHMDYFDLTGHLDGTAHGSPIATDTRTFPNDATGNPGMPEEVACCLSFHADYAGDPEFAGITRPRARDRGRVYIGPLRTIAGSADTNGNVRVAANLRTTIKAAAAVLRDKPNHAWSVWSRKNAAVEPVTAGWVDDSFDIQRRRGEAPSSRTTF